MRLAYMNVRITPAGEVNVTAVIHGRVPGVPRFYRKITRPSLARLARYVGEHLPEDDSAAAYWLELSGTLLISV
jgi:hypothetical protein